MPESPSKSPTSTLNFGCSSPQPVKSRRRPRAVSFAPPSELTQELPDTEFTLEDMEGMWFSKDEFRLIKQSYRFIVKLMESKQGLLQDEEEEDEMCSRGLESKTRVASRRRRQQIEASVDAVLCEQERQWENGYHSIRGLAQVYRQFAAQSSMLAYIAAQKDAKHTESDRFVLSRDSVLQSPFSSGILRNQSNAKSTGEFS